MADLQKLELVDLSFYENNEKTIYPEYSCNCQKSWKKEDRFIVYKSESYGNLNKILDTEVNETNVESLIKLSKEIMTDKSIISGGHTVVDLKDRFSISKEVANSVKFCIDYIVRAKKELNITPDFLMEINDFYMEKSDGQEIDGSNHYRKQAVSPYVMPIYVNKLIRKIKKDFEIDIKSFYVSEKNMADRFKRHIKSKITSNPAFRQSNQDVFMEAGGENFLVIKNNKPTCAAGNAATFRAIRYSVSSNKIFDNYTSHIGVFPLCSLDNVLNGYRAATSFYGNLNLPCLLVFFGKSCFE